MVVVLAGVGTALYTLSVLLETSWRGGSPTGSGDDGWSGASTT